MRTLRVTMVLLLACAAAQAADMVWWEGESAAEHNFPPNSWFAARRFAKARHLLSGGDWLTASGKRKGPEVFARYDVAVPADGEYALWVRKFWKHGPFRWRFDETPWRECGRDIALADNVFLMRHTCANWVSLGKVTLAKGRRRFELRLLAGEGGNLVSGFDCFLLTRGPFMPNGKWKPGEKSGLAEEGWFAFEPPLDAFTDDALLDLRSLNERTAGEKGHVRRRGDAFVLGDGTPVRFWGVNVGPNNIGQDRASIDYLARRLAKLGCNIVRYHGPIFSRQGDPAKVDPKRLDDLHYLVAALKRQGIYTYVSFYFPLWFSVQPHYGIEGYDTIKNKKPFALLFFEPRMQQIYRSWARALLTTSNPHTGLPLGQDPAVAIVEIQNEDSFFFWTFARKNIPEVQMQKLEKRFGDWLKKRDGDLAKTINLWEGAPHKADRIHQGRVGLYDAWRMTRRGLAKANRGVRRRVSDQVRFLTETQRGFYTATAEHFRKDLGAKCLIAAGNWKTADAALLDGLERYTYTACDVIDRHGYFTCVHTGEGARYSVRTGHTFQDAAAVTSAERLPIQVYQVHGYPHTISEIGWPNPNRLKADMTFLAAAYGAMQGIDGFFFFSVGSNFLRETGMPKFPVSTPVVCGSFPAAALMYRRADVKEADPAVFRVLPPDDLYALKGDAVFAAPALDALREGDGPAAAHPARPSVDPLSFYAGRVVRQFSVASTEGPAGPPTGIDRQSGVVRSVTKELEWRFRDGLVRLNAPRCQGTAGYLGKAGRVDLGDVSITCANAYACVLVVSLDARPIADSRRLLIQAVTEDKPYGFQVQGRRITALGGAPYNVRKVDATLTLRLRGAGRPRVTPLDGNGYAAGDPLPVQGAGPVTLHLAPDAFYHILTR